MTAETVKTVETIETAETVATIGVAAEERLDLWRGVAIKRLTIA